jgi:hypothetical protein
MVIPKKTVVLLMNQKKVTMFVHACFLSRSDSDYHDCLSDGAGAFHSIAALIVVH